MMRYSKLLPKHIAAEYRPFLDGATLANRKKQVNVDIRISRSRFLGKGCYLVFIDCDTKKTLLELKIIKDRRTKYRVVW